MLTAVTGVNWGDEGKGRVIDLLAEKADIVVRYRPDRTRIRFRRPLPRRQQRRTHRRNRAGEIYSQSSTLRHTSFQGNLYIRRWYGGRPGASVKGDCTNP